MGLRGRSSTLQMKTDKRWRFEVAVERRSSHRHQLSVPILFAWIRADGARREGCGFTRDMSPTGTYVCCDGECPAVTTVIKIELLLPALDANTFGLKLRADGYVVRVGGPQENHGFAIRTALSVCD